MNKILLGTILALGLPFAANAVEYTVHMTFDEDSGEVAFHPKRLEVKSGDTVIFENVDAYNVHNVMFEPNGIPKGADVPMMSSRAHTSTTATRITIWAWLVKSSSIALQPRTR